MTEQLPTSGTQKLRPRARIISLIGEELISDERVAVVELVKNAYDADATSVTIQFSEPGPNGPDELEIVDDGHGMTLETVLGGWFEPGTAAKKLNDRSPGGRLVQGAKGVGRFAAARLAPTLRLETKVAGATEGVVVDIDWGRFDDSRFLDEIELAYETRVIEDLSNGTRLRLIGLSQRKAWRTADYGSLQGRLSRLLSPFDEVQDFKIKLVVPGHLEFSGDVVAHGITRKPRYLLKGALSENGEFDGSIEADGKRVKAFKKHRLGKKGEKVTCGSFQIEVRAWDRDRAGLSNLMLEFQMGLREVRRQLDVYSGVSIYRDGFRVHPYGEAGDDWLQLDNRSRQSPTTRLGNNQVIAAIRISRATNPRLLDRTTREGLVHTPEYDALREWVLALLALLETERYTLRPREDAPPEETRTLFEAFDLTELVVAADRQLGPQHPVALLARQSDGEIREGVRRLQEHYSRLLLTAGIGQIVDLVIHEMGSPLGRANREVLHLEKLVARLDADEQKPAMEKAIVDIKGWLEQLVAFRNRLDPKTAGKRGRATSFDVMEEVQGNLALFETLISKQGIKVEVVSPKGDGLIVHMTRGSLSQIIANLLDNAVHWLTRSHGDGNGGRIEIAVKRLDHGFSLQVSDDGPGIDEGDRERVFDPYFSTKPNGMGLGLYIARQVIERYGKLTFVEDGPLRGASFLASFSQNVGL